ncbi:cerberus [Leptodactylus fuscus]|uniref:cerberus n=1 Tax=Leptodactylus fuscus TaxID=238119 RepID=UPI003F4EFD8D
MWLQIVQVLIVCYVASHGEGKDVEIKGRSKYCSFIHQDHLRKEGPQSSVQPQKDIEKDEAMSRIRRANPANGVPKINPHLNEKHGEKSTQGIRFARMLRYCGTRSNKLIDRKVEKSEKKYDQVYWDHFTYKIKAIAKAVHYPIKMQEGQREVCKILIFTQNITHECCDNVTIQNLCFGMCNSRYVPNHRDQLSSRCLPLRITLNYVKPNCPGFDDVIKVKMIMEESKCRVHRHNKVKNNHHSGHL